MLLENLSVWSLLRDHQSSLILPRYVQSMKFVDRRNKFLIVLLQTIVGVTTIRAFGNSKQFLQRMVNLSDINSRPYNNVWIVNRWVSVRFSTLGAIINSMTALVIILNLDYIDASLAGLCISFTLNFTDQVCNWLIMTNARNECTHRYAYYRCSGL